MRAYIFIRYLNKDFEKVPDSIDVINEFWDALVIKEFKDIDELKEYTQNLRKNYKVLINTSIERGKAIGKNPYLYPSFPPPESSSSGGDAYSPQK